MGVENHQVNEELLLKQITELVINQRLLSGKTNAEDRVVNFVHPEDLKVYSNFKMFIFNLLDLHFFCCYLFLQKLVDLSLGGNPLNHVQILELCKQAVEYSVKTNHPKFLNQLYHACDPVGLAGAWLSEALNTNL